MILRRLSRPLALAALAAVTALAAPALADRSYNAETNISHDCAAEPEVSLNASGATAVFTGTCTKIAVNGASNTVTIASVKKLKVNGATNTVAVDAADEISATGMSNTVTYKRGLTRKQPVVKRPGSNNTVTRVK